MYVCTAEHIKFYVSLKEGKGNFKWKDRESPDNNSYLYSLFCLQRTFTCTLILNPHNSSMGGNIVPSLFHMGEIKDQRG